MATKRPQPVHQMTSAQFDEMFPLGDEDACKHYLRARRWPNGVHCPRCGNPKVYDLKSRKWHWQCEPCAPDGYRFSIIAGTIFENTNKPLRDWFKVTHLMMTSQKGISARQLWRYMGFGSLKTAWYMAHRIRTALIEPEVQLGGIVEVDETYIGGKAINKHGGKSGAVGGTRGKMPIIGAVSRKGNVVTRVLESVPRRPPRLSSARRSRRTKAASTTTSPSMDTSTERWTTAFVSTLSAQSTLRRSRASGRSSNAASWEASTRSAPSTCRSMLPSSNSAIIIDKTRTFSERRLRDARRTDPFSELGMFSGLVAIFLGVIVCTFLWATLYEPPPRGGPLIQQDDPQASTTQQLTEAQHGNSRGGPLAVTRVPPQARHSRERAV